MKIVLKFLSILIILFFILIIGLIFHPKRIVYEPRIIGQVIDQNGNPVTSAFVSRIEEKEPKNKKFGYYEYIEYKSQIVKADSNGKFELAEKSKIDWIHLLFELPFVWCCANFEVSKVNYVTYKTKFDDYTEYNENLNACKGIVFKPKIILKKL